MHQVLLSAFHLIFHAPLSFSFSHSLILALSLSLIHPLLSLSAHYSNELLLLHRALSEQLRHVLTLPDEVQLDEFFTTLERMAPGFSLYSSFVDQTRPQNIQVWERRVGREEEGRGGGIERKKELGGGGV